MMWMTQSLLWPKASKCYETLRDVDVNNDSTSYAQASNSYEQLMAMDAMNNPRS